MAIGTIRIRAVEANSPTIYLQQHLKNAKVVTWPIQPAYEELLKKFAASEVDAFAGNHARLVEGTARYPGLRVTQDNFADMQQNIVVQKGDSLKLKLVNEFLDDARASGQSLREWKRHLRKSRSGILSDHNSTDAPRCRADILKSKALPRSVKSAGCWLESSSARQSQAARRYPQVVWAG